MEYIVYLTENKINGKKYVGKHTSKDLSKDHYIGSGVLLLQAIKKYGRKNFTFKVLGKYKNEDEAFEYEKYFVRFYDTLNNGYNLKDGGRGGMSGYIMSNETREKKRLCFLGKRNGSNNPNYGKGEIYDVYDCQTLNLLHSGITTCEIQKLYGIKQKYVSRYAKNSYSFCENKYILTIHNQKPTYRFVESSILKYDVFDIESGQKIYKSLTIKDISGILSVKPKILSRQAKMFYKTLNRYFCVPENKYNSLDEIFKEKKSNRKPMSVEARLKLSLFNKGKKLSQKTRKKIAITRAERGYTGRNHNSYGKGNHYDVYKDNIKIAENIAPFDVNELIGMSKKDVIIYAKRGCIYKKHFFIKFAEKQSV